MRHVRGLSLLEVMLAIAIFGGSVAVIGELIRLGTRSAMEARELTTAQLYCESKMAEIAAGIMPQEPMGLTPIDFATATPEWYYAVDVVPSERDGVLAVQVMVVKNPDLPTTQPISFSLVRWMKDAALVEMGFWEDLEATSEAAAAAAEASSSMAPASGSGSGGGAGGAGGAGAVGGGEAMDDGVPGGFGGLPGGFGGPGGRGGGPGGRGGGPGSGGPGGRGGAADGRGGQGDAGDGRQGGFGGNVPPGMRGGGGFRGGGPPGGGNRGGGAPRGGRGGGNAPGR